MDLKSLDIKRLLPAFMRKDAFCAALADVLSELLCNTVSKIDMYSVWDHIDELDEDTLDQLAWELSVDWYDKSEDVSVKRSLIKNSDLVHMKLGTPWAVMQVIQDYFGYGEMREWWQYGKDPHHFKILSANPRITNEDLDKFLKILHPIKRASSWLDGILIALTGEMPLNIGIASRIKVSERHDMTMPAEFLRLGDMSLRIGVASRSVIHERHDMTVNSVVSVNNKSGYVTLTTTDVPEKTNLYFTDERAKEGFDAFIKNSTSRELKDFETLIYSIDKLVIKDEEVE